MMEPLTEKPLETEEDTNSRAWGKKELPNLFFFKRASGWNQQIEQQPWLEDQATEKVVGFSIRIVGASETIVKTLNVLKTHWFKHQIPGVPAEAKKQEAEEAAKEAFFFF